MKSIKPGRGPSGMGFAGSVAAIVFGVFWTIIAFSITAGSPFGLVGAIFPLFGVVFIILGIIQAAYNYKNATGKDRYSIIDIVDSSEEGDPSDKWIKDKDKESESKDSGSEEKTDRNFCPYCGTALDSDFAYCPKCGKQLDK